MHEAALAQRIIDTVTETVQAGVVQGRVRSVCLRVGRLTSVMPENLQFMFDVLSRDTPLSGVSLRIENVPLRCGCRTCGVESELDQPFLSCPACGSSNVDVLSGRELLIDALEVD
jgi:hydrogenase nickel incorporation protein HypA/HybF